MSALVLMTAAAVFALEPQAPEPPLRPLPHLSAVRVAEPPKIDGHLDEVVWQSASGSDAFTQQSPYDGAPPSERTRVKVLYDDDALYVAASTASRSTRRIVELLTRRDRDSESEWVWVYVDSRNDGKSAFVFAVNVAGVLADGQIIDQTTQAWDWDENWRARRAHTPHGWSVEIRIPLRVLRFDGSLPVQSWGFQATRFIADRQEADLWAYSPREVASPVAFSGGSTTCGTSRPVARSSCVPSCSGRWPATTPVRTWPARDGRRRDRLGLDLRWHLAQDLTLDAAFNPDFAQVEADQVILNLTQFRNAAAREAARSFWKGSTPFLSRCKSSIRDGSGGAARSHDARECGGRSHGNCRRESCAGDDLWRWQDCGTHRAGLDHRGAERAHRHEQSAVREPPRTGRDANRLAAPASAFNVLRLKRELGGAGHVGLIGTAANGFEGDRTYPTDAALALPALPVGGATATLGSRCFHDAYVGG